MSPLLGKAWSGKEWVLRKSPVTGALSRAEIISHWVSELEALRGLRYARETYLTSDLAARSRGADWGNPTNSLRRGTAGRLFYAEPDTDVERH